MGSPPTLESVRLRGLFFFLGADGLGPHTITTLAAFDRDE